ncbi:MAG: serine hydrolase [Winogradskyella sp.]|uniref:serine hydrolase n=1 Tax=Winogradskyella sp. TaxID=1883156 RepID=UPI000F3E5C3D|nr:serine hydrolase [Winogradskyella sp.]RNC86328.1 MAG: serine hydrolase [Winogradskyella sp.]
MKNFYLFLFVIAFQFSLSQNAEIKDDVKVYIKAMVDEGHVPSIAMTYMEGDATESFNYGNTKLENGDAVNENSVYEIGSISKVFTCIVLADEVLKGNMSLDDPISKYLPKEFKAIKGANREITLKDLATHTSGLPRMPSNFNPKDPENPFADYTVKELYEFLDSYTLTRDVGAQYEYSNLAMGLLGHILELSTGTPYADLIKARITDPLDMKSTGIVINDNMKSNLAYGYNVELKITKNWDLNVLAGAGAIKSTTSDMIKFFKANVTESDTDLYKAMALSHEVAYIDSNTNLNIGLGWHYNSDGTIIWHNGGTGGYKAFGGFVKGTDKAVIVFTNSAEIVDLVGVKQLGQEVELKLPVKREFPEIVDVSEDVLGTYVGKYELTPNFHIAIRHDKKQLFARATGQQEFEVYPSAENEFFLKIVEASITFNKNESGVVESLTLHQNGQHMPAKKVE